MTDTSADTVYGDRIAGHYRDWFDEQTKACVEVLSSLAGGGTALELGVGTGRVAVPLAAHGVEVHGVDISATMLEALRATPGGDAVKTRLADIATFDIDQTYRLVYAVHSVFFAIKSQPDQLRCFREVAAHLEPGGFFVHEAFVPTGHQLIAGNRFTPVPYGPDQVMLEITNIDPVTQIQQSHQLFFQDGSVRLVPFTVRYVWPSELDLMAELAGMRLRSRTANWAGDPFTAAHTRHVSIYELA